MPQIHSIELPGLEPAACLEQMAQVADDWGAQWQPEGGGGGRLTMAVVAGVRRGLVAGQVSVEALDSGGDSGCRLTFHIDEQHYAVQKPKVVILLLALAGALTLMTAPLIPTLVPLVPLGVMLMLGAWLFIVAGLRNSGPEELLQRLAAWEEERSVDAPR